MEICIGNSNSFISDENIENIFEPFFTFKKENGTGLGLSIAQKIVHLHGGKIKCVSKLNKGVEFIFTLPAVIEYYDKSMYNLPKNINESKLKLIDNNDKSKNVFLQEHNIIVVDDDPLICRTWQRLTKDVNVILFLKPEDCLSFISDNENNLIKIDMIISDYFFGKNSKLSFEDFINILREKYKGKLFLSSDISINEDSLMKEFKIIIIAKKVYTLSELNEIYVTHFPL